MASHEWGIICPTGHLKVLCWVIRTLAFSLHGSRKSSWTPPQKRNLAGSVDFWVLYVVSAVNSWANQHRKHVWILKSPGRCLPNPSDRLTGWRTLLKSLVGYGSSCRSSHRSGGMTNCEISQHFHFDGSIAYLPIWMVEPVNTPGFGQHLSNTCSDHSLSWRWVSGAGQPFHGEMGIEHITLR